MIISLTLQLVNTSEFALTKLDFSSCVARMRPAKGCKIIAINSARIFFPRRIKFCS